MQSGNSMKATWGMTMKRNTLMISEMMMRCYGIVLGLLLLLPSVGWATTYSISVDDVTGVEDTVGSMTFTISVTPAVKAGDQVTVEYATADGTAVSGADYQAVATSTMTFDPGETSKTVSVTVLTDTAVEGDETFTLQLSNPSVAPSAGNSVNLVNSAGTGTIGNDDSATLSVASTGRVTEDAGTAGFTVSSGGVVVEASANVTVSYTATGEAGDTATAGSDYRTITNGSLLFVGTSASVDVQLINDSNVEGDETFTLTLTGSSNADVTASASAQGTIADDGDTATLTITSDGPQAENAGSSTFTVDSGGVRVEPSANLTVSYRATSETGDTATAGSDYVDTASGSIPFVGTSGLISVDLNDDSAVEGDETFTVTLTGTNDTDVTATSSAQATITDDGDAATLSIVSDGAEVENAGPSTFTVSSGGVTVEPSANLTVSYRAASESGDTATAGSDYVDTASGSISFVGSSGVISVALVDDSAVEGDETFTVTLTGASDADVVASDAARATITDDGDTATLSIVSDGAQPEDAGPSTFTLSSSAVVESSANVQVGYTATTESGDTATAGIDYTDTTSGSVPFVGTSGKISVPLDDDSNVEGNETFTLTLTGTSTADVVASGSAQGVIIDNDTASLTIDDISVNEGDGTATFTVTSDSLVEGSTVVTVDFATQDISAVAGEDYTSGSGTVSISGTDSATVTVSILDDSPPVVEGDETFSIVLAGASSNATLADDTGVCTISDNDIPHLSINDVTLPEGDSSDTSVTFTVTSSMAVAPNATLSFDYAVNAVTTEPGDFSGATSGTATISNGSSGSVTLTCTADQVVETDESYTVDLSNATISDSTILPIFDDNSGDGVLVNDDSPRLVISDVSVPEGDSGSSTVNFTVTSDLLVAPDASVTMNYTVSPVDTETDDIIGPLSGTVTITDGDTGVITIDIAGDVTVEADEQYTVDISGATVPSSTAGALIVDTSGLGTIVNDDAFTVSIDASTRSALEDMGPLVWTVTLSNPVEWQVEVPYTFNADTTDTAREGDDYTDAASSPLVFAPGTTTRDITINLVNDTVIEPDETFTITLSAPDPATSGTLGTKVGTGEILNDEHLITMSAGGPQGTLSTAYGGGVSVTDGTATVQVDHDATPAFDVAMTDSCYHISDLSVDGVSQGALSSYTFDPVTTDHSISVDFAITTYTITATVLGSHGTLTPSQSVNCGTSGYTYVAEADPGYHISWLKVNGVDVAGAAGQENYTYTFGTITGDQTIEVAYTQLITVTEDSPFGEITPAGSKVPIEVDYGDDLTFLVTSIASCPNGLSHDGQVHHISDIIVDGVSLAGVKGSGLTSYSYTFSNITTDHTIEAQFTAFIDMTVNGNGTTDPLAVTTTGSLEVDAHDSPVITAVPDSGFHVSAVEIDGAPVGQPESYTFTDMYDEDHTYEVWFSIDTFTLKPVSRFGTVYETAAQSVVATEREVSYHDTSSFYVDLDDPDHAVMGILIDNISYPIPASGVTTTYPAFTLINTADDYLEVRFTNVEVGHRLEVQDYDTSPISDVPLDARLRPKPASLMFVLDDSGSMDWEFIVPGNGLYNGRYYVYSYPSVAEARVYSNNSIQANGEEGEWRSQWAGINKMFYNPEVEYVPWPSFTGTPSSNLPAADSSIAGQTDGLAHANIYRPRYHPWHSQDCTEALNKALGATPDNLAACSNNETFDMDGTFLDLSGTTDDHGDTRATATPVSLNNNYIADLETTGDHDVFRIELTSTGDLLVRTLRTSQCTDTEVRILDAAGNTYRYSDYGPYNQYLDNPYADDCGSSSWCDMSCGRDQDPYIYLTGVPAGTYYIDVRGFAENRTGTYILDLAFTGSSITFPDPPAPSVGIINAHYFTWEDTNGNGVIDFVDSNGNGQLDINETINENIWLVNLTDPIEYYRVLDSSQEASAANLQQVDPASVPSTVRTFVSPTDPDAWRKERQNWADWFSYYRKRIYSATAAVSRVISRMEDIEVGYRTINYRNGGYENGGYGFSQSVLPVKVSGVGDETNRLLEILYAFQIDAYGTPLRNGLNAVGQYYDDTDTADGGIGTSPFHAREDGDECKQVFAIAMTDGYWNGGSPAVGNTDGDNGAPYADTFSNTLADVAMRYFERDLSTLDDLVPDGTNTHQHMVTYTVAFGVNGTLNPDDYDLSNGVYPSWPNPTSSDSARVDDLWHAAVNGHGKYMNAARPDELVASLLEIMTDIGSRIGSGASVSVNGDEMYENVNGQVRMFQTTYNSGDWHGDLKAYQLNTTTGEVLTNSPVWSAEEQLRDLLLSSGPDGRIIATYDGTNGVPFRWQDAANNPYLTARQQKMLQPYYAQSLSGEDMLNYLRGDGSHEGSFRDRDLQHPLGDFVHSLARFEDGFLYVGGNDGMLHAFWAIDSEDLDSDGVLDAGVEDIDGDGHFDTVYEDKDGDCHLDTVNEDVDGDGKLDYNEDLDGDGILDVPEDIDGDGRLDTVDEDVDGDGTLDLVNEDLDGDDHLDTGNEDLNGNGQMDPGEDLDGDGHFDTVNEDIDNDGHLDVNEDLDNDGHLDVNEDRDNDGVLNTVNEDLDGDGVLDVDEDLDNDGVLDVPEDLDGDGHLDLGEDVNCNGILDSGEDLDGDGILDLTEDLDGDGNFDTVKEDQDNNGQISTGGEERFAYVPGLVFRNLRELGDPLYDHKFYVDNTPYTKKVGDTTLLVGGLGKGGKGYYCLDITNAGSISSEADLASRVLWEYPAPPPTLVSGTTFTFSSGTGTGGNDEIKDSAGQFTAANGFEVGRWITVIGANYNDGSNSGSNDGSYRIKAVAADGSTIELEAGSLINGYGDGEDITITAATSDRDMGYSFSRAYIVQTYDSTINAGTDFEGYVVIFGNGYSSENGTAVLYILNPLDGSLIKKIKTRVGPFNGLSTPKIIDMNNDLKADYVYAGDLLGNMWKFDLTSDDHADWQVAFCDNADATDHCKDTDDQDDTDDPVPNFTAQPLFGGLANQAITGAPDVMFHSGGPGYMVIFGTGKYIGEPDLTNFEVQSLYGIWDWAPDNADDGYNGVRVDTTSTPSVATLSNWPETDTSGGQATHTLLKQVIWVEGAITEDTDGDGHLDVDEDHNGNGILDAGEDIDGDGHLDVEEDTNENGQIDVFSYYRIPSNYPGNWETVATKDLSPGHHLYNRDLNGDGYVNNLDKVPVANVGWYFDLPGKIDLDGDRQDNDKDGLIDEDDDGDGIIDERMPGERVVNDTIIRDGKAIMISFGVTGTRCNAGAYSFVNERDPDTGGMLGRPAFDVDGDGEVNNHDRVYIRVNEDVDGDGDIDENDVVPGIPTDKAYEGRLYNPAILRENEQSGDDQPEETKYFSSSGGTIETLVERAERRGVYFWQQVE